jgi:hypothetical protein
MMFSLMGGSAAISLPSLGGSSIQPGIVAMGFLVLRLLMPGQTSSQAAATALLANGWFAVFVIYGAVSAYILPTLFANSMDITPLRPVDGKHLFAISPLYFRAQNITISVYMLIGLFSAVASFIAVQRPGGLRNFVRATEAVAIIHALLGISGALLANTAAGAFFTFFRNGGYAMLSQSISGVVRISGIWPELSGYAAYDFIFFVFLTELWLRNVRPRQTGFAAGLLGLTLLASTSSTFLVGAAAYGLALLIRQFYVPGSFRLTKSLVGLAAVLAALGLSLATAVAGGHTAALMQKAFNVIIFEKADSESGMQRLFWAKQGIDAFFVSYGLGIGAGSFRSSSLVTAIHGSLGIIGIVSITAHVWCCWQPLRSARWISRDHHSADHIEDAIGRSAGWAMIVYLFPAAIAAPSPDPGYVWAIFTGIVLALGANRLRSDIYAGYAPDLSIGDLRGRRPRPRE